MKTPQELYAMGVTIYNEACDGIAELMRSHNRDELNIKKYEYEYDLQLPVIQAYVYDSYQLDGDDEGYVSTRPTLLNLVPGHISIELDRYNGGGYVTTTNETNLNLLEVLQLYRVVDEIFRFLDEKVEPYHEYPEDKDEE